MVELIQYVNPDGTLTGETAEKYAAHNDKTRKHLAFSSYVFDTSGKFLVSQRALSKKVWPGVWTNSCCGHPLPGESVEDAIRRRLDYELGITEITDLTCVIPDYSYETPAFKGIIENEFCPVYLVKLTGQLDPNPDEVEAVRWMTWHDYKTWLNTEPELFSYWCKQQAGLLEEAVTDFLR